MKKRKSAGKKDTSILVHITFGLLLSLIVSFLLSTLATVLIEREITPIASMNMLMIGIHVLSVFVGTTLATSMEKGRIAIVAGIVTACYFLILVCINMLLFSEGFENLGIGVLSIIAGGLIAVLAKSKTGRSKKRHIKMRSR